MKKAFFILALIGALSVYIKAEHFWLLYGGEAGTIFGKGIGNNEFNWGGGVFMEIGGTGNDGLGLNFGFSLISLENTVTDNTISLTAVPIYADIRYFIDIKKKFFGSSPLSLFFSLGALLGYYHYATINGSDDVYGFTAGIGAFTSFDYIFPFAINIKPMYLLGNDLGQNFALEIQFAIGLGN